MTRGRCGSLALHRMTLSFTPPRRFDPAHKEMTMKPRTRAAFVWMASSLASGAIGGRALAAPATPCVQAADDVERSCREGAQSDYWLHTAKCDNVSDSAARKLCQSQASEDQIEAVSTCDDQGDARDAICAR